MTTDQVTPASLLSRILERIEEEREDGGELPIHEAEMRIKHVLHVLSRSPTEGTQNGD